MNNRIVMINIQSGIQVAARGNNYPYVHRRRNHRYRHLWETIQLSGERTEETERPCREKGYKRRETSGKGRMSGKMRDFPYKISSAGV